MVKLRKIQLFVFHCDGIYEWFVLATIVSMSRLKWKHCIVKNADKYLQATAILIAFILATKYEAIFQCTSTDNI